MSRPAAPRGRHRHPHRIPHRIPRRVSRHGLAVVLALVAGLGVGVGGAGTYAFWSDRATVTTGSLESGGLDLHVDDQAVGLGTDWTKSAIAFSGRTPGEQEAYPLRFRNEGDPPGTYTLSVLRGETWTYGDDAVVVQAFTGTVAEDTGYPQQDTCTGDALGPAQLLTSSAPFPLLDAPRPLAADAEETLCLRVGIATAAGDANQNRTGTLRFRATLTQVT